MQAPNPGSVSSSSSSSSPPVLDVNFFNPGTTACTQGVCWNDAAEVAFQEYLIATRGGKPALDQVPMSIPQPPQPQPYFAGRNDESLLGQWRSFPECDSEKKLVDLGYLERQLHLTPDLVGRSEGAKLADEQRIAKTTERRQKRMIKNRESAARSRAKKQAYTNELQERAMKLREANAFLKKKNEVIIFLDSIEQGPRYQLRRTSSC